MTDSVAVRTESVNIHVFYNDLIYWLYISFTVEVSGDKTYIILINLERRKLMW